MSTPDGTCPHCGAPLKIDPDSTSTTCAYCKTPVTLDVIRPSSQAQDAQVIQGTAPQTLPTAPVAQAAASSLPANISPSNRLVAFLLCLLLGWLGVHRYYTGHILLGLIYTLTWGVFGIGWIVDLIRIAIGNYTDSSGRLLGSW